MQTTIQIQKRTVQRLKKLKGYERETYDELLNNMAEIVEIVEKQTKEKEASPEFLERLEEIRKGRFVKVKDFASHFGA